MKKKTDVTNLELYVGGFMLGVCMILSMFLG